MSTFSVFNNFNKFLSSKNELYLDVKLLLSQKSSYVTKSWGLGFFVSSIDSPKLYLITL